MGWAARGWLPDTGMLKSPNHHKRVAMKIRMQFANTCTYSRHSVAYMLATVSGWRMDQTFMPLVLTLIYDRPSSVAHAPRFDATGHLAYKTLVSTRYYSQRVV
jgi:hypothetical protein